MTLDPTLAAKVKKASDKQFRQSSRPTTGRAIFADLHQIITGTDAAARTAQATDYAVAVATEGTLVRSKTPVIIDGSAWPSGIRLAAALKKGERGVTIVDNIDSLTAEQMTKFREKLADLMSSGHGVFVITGTPQGIARLTQGHPVLEKKLNDPLDLSQPSSPAAQPAPGAASPSPDATTQPAPVNRQEEIIALWRKTRDCDICATPNDVVAPVMARFIKKPESQL